MSVAVENLTCNCRKIAYVSRREAMQSLKRNNGKAVYRCPDTDLWHVTSKPRVAKKHASENAREPKIAREVKRHRKTQARAQRPLLHVVQASAPAPVVKGKTACVKCGRPWLSDLSPVGRVCPGRHGVLCGGEIRVGRGDGRDFIRELALGEAA